MVRTLVPILIEAQHMHFKEIAFSLFFAPFSLPLLIQIKLQKLNLFHFVHFTSYDCLNCIFYGLRCLPFFLSSPTVYNNMRFGGGNCISYSYLTEKKNKIYMSIKSLRIFVCNIGCLYMRLHMRSSCFFCQFTTNCFIFLRAFFALVMLILFLRTNSQESIRSFVHFTFLRIFFFIRPQSAVRFASMNILKFYLER